MNRRFHAPAPDRLWVSDFTHVATWQGFAHVAFVLDAYARRIAGRARQPQRHRRLRRGRPRAGDPPAPTCKGRRADRPLGPRVAVSCHSVRPGRLAEAGIEPSVGSVGDSRDNALAETVIGLFKTEVIRRRGPWCSLETVEFATLEPKVRAQQRMGAPVQPPPPARTHRARPARRGRGALPRPTGEHRRGGVECQTKSPPANTGRFKARFPLSLRMVKELLLERGIDVSCETIRRWEMKFGPAPGRGLRRRASRPGDIWHLDGNRPIGTAA